MESQLIALSCDDDFCVSMLFRDSENPENDQTLMSDDSFAEELQLQEVIISSLINLQKKSGDDSASGDVSIEIGESSIMGAKKAGESSSLSMYQIVKKAGESSSSLSLCEICAERKNCDDMFPLQNCSHSFCTHCISKHISIEIKKQRTLVNTEKGPVACPGLDCTTVLEVYSCREIVPGDIVSMWDDLICESMISPSLKCFCPYKNCSELLVKESEQEVVVEAECPFCKRLFCARCNVPWHSGFNCEEYSRLNENERGRGDLIVHDLAKKNKWQRCPNCKFYVEKNQGCLHMTCRCGFQFCYACGNAWSSTHGGCQ